MGTRFELVLPGEDTAALRAAGEVALAEVERIEAELSPYRATSQTAHLNAFAAVQPVKVTPELFGLLNRTKDIWNRTQGAFDVTVGPLLRFLGNTNGPDRPPTAHELTAVRTMLGMDKVELIEPDATVRFMRSGMQIDFGAIGKGYAIDAAVAVLRDAGIENALVHAGTSTVFALGKPPDAAAWRVAILSPPDSFMSTENAAGALTAVDECALRAPVCVVELADAALSVSTIWGRSFQTNNRTISHIVDPRSGEPVRDTLLGAVIWKNATEADALSTAVVVLGAEGLEKLACEFVGIRMLCIAGTAVNKKASIETIGFDCKWSGPAPNPPEL